MALLTVQACDNFVALVFMMILFFFFTDIDECVLGVHNCSVDANCTNTVGSFNCSCNSGYFGDGVNCSKFIIIWKTLLCIFTAT